jgi:hypothetical protein
VARLGCTSPEAARGTAEAGLRWMHEHMLFHSTDQKLQGPFGATVDKVENPSPSPSPSPSPNPNPNPDPDPDPYPYP